MSKPSQIRTYILKGDTQALLRHIDGGIFQFHRTFLQLGGSSNVVRINIAVKAGSGQGTEAYLDLAYYRTSRSRNEVQGGWVSEIGFRRGRRN